MFELEMEACAAQGFADRLEDDLGLPGDDETWLRAENPHQIAGEHGKLGFASAGFGDDRMPPTAPARAKQILCEQRGKRGAERSAGHSQLAAQFAFR